MPIIKDMKPKEYNPEETKECFSIELTPEDVDIVISYIMEKKIKTFVELRKMSSKDLSGLIQEHFKEALLSKEKKDNLEPEDFLDIFKKKKQFPSPKYIDPMPLIQPQYPPQPHPWTLPNTTITYKTSLSSSPDEDFLTMNVKNGKENLSFEKSEYKLNQSSLIKMLDDSLQRFSGE